VIAGTFATSARRLGRCVPALGSRTRVLQHDYDHKSFGNALVELKSDAIRLRFVRDMGIIFAQVASPAAPDDWLGLQWVLEAILGEPAETFMGRRELEPW
jgi:hypothetical protein